MAPPFTAVSCTALIVIADAHLGAAPPDAEPRLLRFLEQVPDLGDALLVNGDLFDFWFGYGQVVPRAGLRVLGALAALARRVPVHLVGGNHDRWGDGGWATDLGLQWARESLELTVGGARLLAQHGDGLTANGLADRLVHALVGARATSLLYRAVPPALGLPLVRRLSPWLGDRRMDESALARAAARQAAAADRLLAAESDLAWLVLGHTHRAVHRTTANGRHHLNPGAWFDGGRYAIVHADRATLATFD